MVLCLILDSKNELASQPLIAETPQDLLNGLIQMNPENLSDLTIQPILYFDSINELAHDCSQLLDEDSLPGESYRPIVLSKYTEAPNFFNDPIDEKN